MAKKKKELQDPLSLDPQIVWEKMTSGGATDDGFLTDRHRT